MKMQLTFFELIYTFFGVSMTTFIRHPHICKNSYEGCLLFHSLQEAFTYYYKTLYLKDN